MTLMYRAIWDEPDHVATAVLADEFSTWIRSKGIDPEMVPYRGVEEVGSNTIEVRRADAEVGSILRCRLIENRTGSTWTSTVTALAPADAAAPTYWVDVEFDGDVGKRRLAMAAPRIARQLLDVGGSPRRGPVTIRTTPRVILNPDEALEVSELILHPERDLAVVVFSPDETVEPDLNHRRAALAAERLAGIATVFLMSPSAIGPFNALLPNGLGVFKGAARHYLPGIQIGDVSESARHRWYAPRLFNRSPRRAGELISANLTSLQLWPAEPVGWARLRGLITRPTDEQIAERAADIVAGRGPAPAGDESSDEKVALLSGERDELIELLVLAEADRDAQVQSLERELARVREQASQRESDWLDSIDSEEAAQQEILALNAVIRALHTNRPGSEGEGTDHEEPPEFLEAPSGIVEAVALAQSTLRDVVIHAEAPQDLDRMEESYKSRTWARGIWQGLVALNNYCQDVARGAAHSGFFQWCGETAGWSPAKLAMTESQSVMTNDRLRAHRHLPVSTAVDPSGRIDMQAHLKIQQGGNGLIPRIYFHDDTRGETGQVHVGFIGPHDLMPNTKTA